MSVPCEGRGLASPSVAVVLPVYSHSGLVIEALLSLERQEGVRPTAVALVNDGCRFHETDLVGAEFQATEVSFALHNVRRTNGGLSAARNTGIDFLLSRYPAVEALYMLDADNRLEPYALAHMARAMAEHPESDWFYPDIEMFGLDRTAGYGGEYSALAHRFTNVSEAGSLVRRRVFDAGVRFDESMRQGYEDWEFWLASQAAGFKGRHLPDMGFRYRKRPESMLAESTREDGEIKSYIRRKHRALYSPRCLLELEARVAPRYAVVIDNEHVRIGSDLTACEEVIPLAQFAQRVWRWMLRPDENFVPPFLAYAQSEHLQLLERCKLLGWALWDLESRLRDGHIASLTIEPFASSGSAIAVERRGSPGQVGEGHLAMGAMHLLRDVFRDANLNWWDGILAPDAAISISDRSIFVDEVSQWETPRAVRGLHDAVANLFTSKFRAALAVEWRWAHSGQPDRHQVYKSVRAMVGQGVVLPRACDGRRHVAMICSFADFGGVEKVALNVAASLKANGFAVHFVLFRTGEIHVPKVFEDVFESFAWVTADGLVRWDGDDFDGTRLSWWSQFGDKANSIGLLANFDVVINCQSADAHGIMGDLKRLGVVTLTHQHIVEYSPAGRAGGSAVLARAFEHSYDHFLTGSSQLLDWFVANGVPREKLSHVRNAASYPLAEEKIEAIRAERLNRSQDIPLRLLFAARFDAQKGVDRLVRLHAKTKADDMDLDWRVVGKAIVDEASDLSALRAFDGIEAPVYSPEALNELYTWADVILLPSRYEGVPLTVIEAMRCGAVVLAADAGAVREVIMDGVDGVIVPQEHCVASMHAALKRLSSDRDELKRLAAAAILSSSGRSWDESVAPVAAKIHALINVRAKRNATTTDG